MSDTRPDTPPDTSQRSPGPLTVWLRLGRVSNLPTVWSNVLVGVCLGVYSSGSLAISAGFELVVGAMLLLALTAFYTGGMFLNDAFDAAIDKLERPERPIPAGEVSRFTVFFAGGTLQVVGILFVAAAANLASTGPLLATVVATLLALMIVLYNAWHKNNPLSPMLMACCRVLVYLTCAATLSGTVLSSALVLACLAMFAYLSGLTAIAKQENLDQLSGSWPLLLLFLPVPVAFIIAQDFHWLLILLVVGFLYWTVDIRNRLVRGGAAVIGQSVARLIAGISLLDMLVVVALVLHRSGADDSTGLLSHYGLGVALTLCAVCLGCFLLTRRWQQKIPGT